MKKNLSRRSVVLAGEEIALSNRAFAFAAIAYLVLTSSHAACAAQFKLLYSFMGDPDGRYPVAEVTLDKDGNLYGTTSVGGGSSNGVVFQLDPIGAETVLFAFAGGEAGAEPFAGLLRSGSGGLYGTTSLDGEGYGGTVFKLASNGAEKTLASLVNSGAKNPVATLVSDEAGNLYGETVYDLANGCGGSGCGTIFKLDSTGIVTILHQFEGIRDGYEPLDRHGLVMDSNHNLYGTTSAGGNQHCGGGCGTVFMIATDGSKKVLHKFAAGRDGSRPGGGLVMDAAGTLFGVTQEGGGRGCSDVGGCGTIFRLAADGTYKVLHRFNGDDGIFPLGALVEDVAGNLYGTTSEGGGGCAGDQCGTVFKLTPGGKHTILHAFNRDDGQLPVAALVADKHGHLYGTTEFGGAYLNGTVFEIIP